MSSTFGTLFRVSTFGESHCAAVGAVVDGVPAGMQLRESDIQPQLDRRRPGQSELSTPREEKDLVSILSGVEKGLTLGTPICLLVHNRDQRPGDYREMEAVPRPSHADYSYQMKYGIRASSGGGRSSARETIGRVAAGAIAEKYLAERFGLEIVAWVDGVGELEGGMVDLEGITREQVDATAVRCPNREAAAAMMQLIGSVRDSKDSVGGVVRCVCRNLPAGLGEPVFDKLDALLAHAMLSLPAAKGFEVGSGFGGSRMLGSAHNDPFVRKEGRLGTVTNYSGGVQGGISNGEPVHFRVAFKPPATVSLPQKTAAFDGTETLLEAKGRHDPCIVPRAVPIVESMAALVLMDLVLRQEYRSK
ncbi:chorismate synthase [Citrifermentans bemidjiense Bem]|uniref:Chorismate synthase n=1 Tax=Citrifermentans bemidjiense (strain ATCC BAA-1014 / DSM 16622 / JCM 12645 / Bem) TaxID=404380 RepID=B5EEV0_CITBB|nr:chorismate synthase [Citrifermentans bemidjiense]ACH37846.1 chorismate synthase [Citrifermentans bemidjiense Bem]